MKASIYIIGQNSYIATQISKHFFSLGHRVVGISHAQPFQEPFEPNAIIINCSASYKPDGDWEQMVAANYNYARNYFARSTPSNTIINLGSYFEFGDMSAPGPINNYATAKMLLRAWLNDLSLATGVRVVNLILYDVVGPGDWRPKLFPNIVKLKEGAAFPLTACEQIVNLLPIEHVLHVLSVIVDEMKVSGLVSASNGDFRKLAEYIADFASVIPFRPKFGEVDYSANQIFEPIRGLPAAPVKERFVVDREYIEALAQG